MSDKERQFLAITEQYGAVVAKVCYLYTAPGASFEDLYQETLINLWQGMDMFRGDSKMSTWIYRVSLNTCISWHRRNGRHYSTDRIRLEDVIFEPVDSESSHIEEDYRELYQLISMLPPIDKAVITLWLDEKPYDEIAKIIGISQANVAVRMHRIKEKLSKMAEKSALR